MNRREKRNAKIVFWIVSPFMFAGLVRVFFLVVYFMAGMLLLWMFGIEHNPIIFWLSVFASTFFTIVFLMILYRLFKMHILEEPGENPR